MLHSSPLVITLSDSLLKTEGMLVIAAEDPVHVGITTCLIKPKMFARFVAPLVHLAYVFLIVVVRVFGLRP